MTKSYYTCNLLGMNASHTPETQPQVLDLNGVPEALARQLRDLVQTLRKEQTDSVPENSVTEKSFQDLQFSYLTKDQTDFVVQKRVQRKRLELLEWHEMPRPKGEEA